MSLQDKSMLIVDDMEMNRAILRELFSEHYNIIEAESAKQALDTIKMTPDAVTVMLVDMTMPDMTGYELLDEMDQLALLPKIPVVLITAQDNSDNEIKALNMGAADIIKNPFAVDVAFRRVSNVISAQQSQANLESLALDLSKRLLDSNAVMLDTLSSIIEHRSLECGQHIRRIRSFTEILLRQMSISYDKYNMDGETIETIVSASTLHDIGKIVIPESILKKPNRLTGEEYEIMKTHASEGGKIIQQFSHFHNKEYLKYAYDIARHHHERWDGKGYPDGLCGDEIPLCAQVVGIADAYDALTTARSYRFNFTHEQSIDMILRGDCGSFSDDILNCLRQVSDEFKSVAETYADDSEYALSTAENVRQAWNAVNNESYRIDHLKYMTSLKLLKGISAEIDFTSGQYKVVYPKAAAREYIELEGEFEPMAEKFIKRYVHPEHQKRLLSRLNMTGPSARSKIPEGTSEYLVFNKREKSYQWYKVTFSNIGSSTGGSMLMNINSVNAQKQLENDLRALRERIGSSTDAWDVSGMPPVAVCNELAGGVKKAGGVMFCLSPKDGISIYKSFFAEEMQQSFPLTIQQLEDDAQFVLHPNDSAKYKALLRDIQAGKEHAPLDFQCMWKGGEYKWFGIRTLAVPAVGGESNIVGVIIGLSD